ncbi:phage head-tail adaptor, putative, SPP1 family [Polaromonas sp. OV174]|uniref:phage head closure protein n=1 Tax=Polaromonas sp. OV174 TaxID=1855300 RepID=UPI0008E9E64F|nr:phage head closure protein [Polaromonas sp. OV174]SFB74192.1 phage head-tail adaptor, putative, SPP1 family [Polaromonas sp. OV174]
MEIGKLNKLITLQRLTEGQDEIGQPVTDWADVAKVWANVRYLSGIQTIKSDAPVSIAKASIRIRRRTDVVAGMRALLGETVFEIKAVLPDEQGREFVDLVCEVLT